MGAHGTFEDALANVTAFNDAVVTAERDARKAKAKGKAGGKKKSKHKKEKDAKRKRGKHKKGRRPSSSDGSSDDSGTSDDGGRLDVNEQLARGREAVRLTRTLLATHPGLRADIRELLRRIDSGAAVDISGLPDVEMRDALHTLFRNLCLRRTSKGLYSQSPYHASVLAFLAPVLEESPAELASALPPPAPAPGAGASGSPSAAVEEDEEEPRASGAAAGPVAAPQEEVEGVTGDASDDEAAPRPQDGGEQGVAKAARRVVGPAMPPPEVLAAAAAVAEQMAADDAAAAAARAAAGLSDAEDDADDARMVGPPPPEFAAEADAASGDDRAREVARVLRALADSRAEAASAAAAGSGGGGKGEGPEADPYAVLGVEPGASKGDVKKQYWRVSLMIHPDKCAHPRAHDAFQAVSAAAKALQDEGQRAGVDKRLAEQQAARDAAEWVAQQERERQWRIVRGEATAMDLAGPAGRRDQRDSWMTDIPAARTVNTAQLSQVSQTSFSLRGIQARGDASGWAATPNQPAANAPAALGYGPAPAAALLEGGGGGRGAAMSGLVDAYNAASRKRSLVEQHQARLKADKKAKKKAVAAGAPAQPGAASGGAAEWAGKHPWRPFDRDKDLGAPRPANAAEALKKAGNLTARFGGGGAGGGRSFL